MTTVILQDNSLCILELITDALQIAKIIEQAKNQDQYFFDYTKLSAINTCPTWGISRYGKHLVLGGSGRSVALDAGTACHKYFHALRLWHLYYNQKDEGAYYSAGSRLFGYSYIKDALKTPQDSDSLTNAINFCTPFLHDSGFYDDPNDRNRTLANLEQACLAYTERRLRNMSNVYIGQSIVGIEVPFAIKITRRYGMFGNTNEQSWYLIGKMDGLHIDDNGRLNCEENKTSARGWMGEPWRMKWNVEHQPTGYMVAAHLLAVGPLEPKHVLNGTVIGLSIPLPKNVFEGVSVEPVSRQHDDIVRWLEWQVHTIELYTKYKDNLLTTPRYTHSCTRFNKLCSMLPFCAASLDEQRAMLEDGSFVSEPWVALEDEVLE